MKKVSTVILITISLLLIGCGKSSLVGKYKNVMPGKTDIEFTKDNHFIFSSEGKSFMSGAYQTDDSLSPKHLAMTMDAKYNTASADDNADKITPAIGIYKFKGNELTIKIANGTDADVAYPKDFKDDPVFLTQQFVSE